MGAPVHQMALNFPAANPQRFDTFICETANAQALHALRQTPGQGDWLLFLHGATGSGKSHLLQALCHEQSQAVYLSFEWKEHFAPEILDSLVDSPLLCLDDIEQLQNEPAWQEALFRLFNARYERQARLVMAASLPPSRLPLNLADLVSRLQWATVYALQPLSEAGRAQALRSRAEERGFHLAEDTLHYILQRSHRDMPALMKVLDMLDQLSLEEQRRVTTPFVRQIMGW